jgi:hypothetical protein
VERTPERVAATVTLLCGDVALTARADHPPAESAGVLAAAEAATAAVGQALPAGVRVVLRRTVVQHSAAGPLVVVHVVVETARGPEHLVGAALGGAGPLEDAAAAAVVDAVERRVQWYRRREPAGPPGGR